MSAPRNAQQRTWRAAGERLRPTRACADASMRIMFGSDCASSKLSPISIESAPMRASDRACKRAAAAAHLASTSRPARCPQRRRGSTRSCTAARAGPPTAGPANARRLVCEQGGVQGATTRHGVEGSLEKLECSHPLSCRIRLLALHQRVGRLRDMNVQHERGARARPARKCAPALQAPHGPQPLRAHARVRGGARSRGGRGAAASRTAAAAQQQPGAAPARVAGAAARRGMPSPRRHQPERS